MRKPMSEVAVSETPTCRQSIFTHRPIRTGILLALLQLVLLFPTVVQAQFNYVITANLTITITGYSGPGGTVIVPDVINGLPVTSIAAYAIAQNQYITNIM